MSDSPDTPFAKPYHCSDCGSEVGFRSRRRTFTERFVLPLFLLRPVRCGECFRRDYRFIFTQVQPRFPDAVRIAPVKQPAPPNRNIA